VSDFLYKETVTTGLSDPYAAWSVIGQIEIPSTFDQLKAVNNSTTINLDAYWPESSFENGCQIPQLFPHITTDVPEFDPYPSLGLKSTDLPSSNYLQEVCI